MKICFSGFDKPIEADKGYVSALEIHNRVLFSRVCGSLASGAGSLAIEPYTIWDGDREVKPQGQFLYVGDPFDLPWDHRLMHGALAARLEKLAFEDEAVRGSLEHANHELSSCITSLALQLDSAYAFGVDWDMKRYLKCFSFGVSIAPEEPLIDNLIKFLLLAKDVSFEKVIVFVNLKLFLGENELDLFYEQAFFSNLALLLVENQHDDYCRVREKKYTIDQDFLEHW